MQYKKDDSMVGRKVANEFILVPIKQNVADLQYMYSLNEVGGRIWELLDDFTSVEKIVSTLVQEYEVEAPQAEADVLEFLAQMKEIGAIMEETKENEK